ncbi:MAG: extensin family protein [Hyphomicrobium sp.]|uniref:extensin family protein n=1 Tax=Hyphomicrobium sp. TaxID=82 RepID=UPI0039E4884D
MSKQEELLARVSAFRSALRSKVVHQADEFAVRSSIFLTRVAFLGILLLPLFEPNSFYIVRAGHSTSPPEAELRARSDVPPVASAVPAGSAETGTPPADKSDDAPPPARTADSAGPNLPASNNSGPTVPALPPTQNDASGKPVPPDKQTAPDWTSAEIADAKQQCEKLLGKVTVETEELPPVREGICGAPAPRLLKSVGESKIKIEPAATLNCQMIAGLSSWINDKLQPAAQKNFGSPVVRVIAESYSCRNRYGLARAPISEHALMNAIDVSAFVLADGKIIRVSRNWGPTADELKRAQKAADAAVAEKAKFQIAASKLGAHDLAKKSVDKDKADEKEKPKSPEALKEEQEKQAMSLFLHQAHDGACRMFDTVLGPDTNDAHHDHFHLDMKERTRHLTLCE